MKSAGRILAMVLRYIYLLRRSWLAQASGVLMAAVLLWDMHFRAHLGVSLAFFEEMYSRNLGHLFVSTLRMTELTGALLAISFLRTLIGIRGAALLAIPLYNFSIFGLGLPLLGFFANLLVMGWSIGLLVAGMVLRYGLGAESFAWVSIFAIAPFSGIYYPVSTLPEWLQPVSWALPSSYVFEGMRELMFAQVVRSDLMWLAAGLNLAYLAAGAGFFLLAFHGARRKGLLLLAGE